MNSKAVYGILIAVLLPLVCYFLLKKYSDDVVSMPRHYIFDSVITGTKNGKQFSDTVWHRIPDFTLTNQLGSKVSWKDMQWEVDGKMEGKIVVADFFFTHCATICPITTRAMRMLQNGIRSSDKVGNRDAEFVQFLSFSIDPERDSVPQLKKWNDNFQINPESWWLLTGDRKTIYDLAVGDMKLQTFDSVNIDSNFVHTDFFVLIDKNRNIRGYYHSLHSYPDQTIDTANISRLAQDIVLLSLEKDPKRRSVFEGTLGLIAVVCSCIIIGIILLVLLLKKEKKQNGPYTSKE